MRIPVAALAGIAILAALPATVVRAGEITVGGLTFSDIEGGFELVDVTGSGTIGDPFIVRERVTGRGPVVLTVEGLTGEYGNRVGTHHTTGFAMVKMVENASGYTWFDYPIELQETLGDESPYGDGLSFAQGAERLRPLAADRYATARAIDEPHDGMLFSDGAVTPGESVVLSFIVTDTTPVDRFYVVQRRRQPIAMLLGTLPVTAR